MSKKTVHWFPLEADAKVEHDQEPSRLRNGCRLVEDGKMSLPIESHASEADGSVVVRTKSGLSREYPADAPNVRVSVIYPVADPAAVAPAPTRRRQRAPSQQSAGATPVRRRRNVDEMVREAADKARAEGIALGESIARAWANGADRLRELQNAASDPDMGLTPSQRDAIAELLRSAYDNGYGVAELVCRMRGGR